MDQPLAQTGNEFTDMLAGDSLFDKPLNMIFNFLNLRMNRRDLMTAIRANGRQCRTGWLHIN
ncbi:hypothetical protein [Rhizobium phaseoli]|uniref:hypothetical protein n=1 Tax=Rhizobium phaseoli TaxID=396 RepID=UPI000B095B98|nr:hypothetical protein [Rhizobium phaseoli]